GPLSCAAGPPQGARPRRGRSLAHPLHRRIPPPLRSRRDRDRGRAWEPALISLVPPRHVLPARISNLPPATAALDTGLSRLGTAHVDGRAAGRSDYARPRSATPRVARRLLEPADPAAAGSSRAAARLRTLAVRA